MKLSIENKGIVDNLERWYKSFLNNLKSLSYSKNTIYLYSRTINNFIEYMREFDEEVTMDRISSIYFTGFLSFMEDLAAKRGVEQNRGYYLSKSTKQAYIKALKNFFEFISDNNDELFSYYRLLKNVKITDSSSREDKIKHFNENEIEALINQLEVNRSKAKSSHSSYLANRNSLLIKLLLYAGLRISEALDLRPKDIIPPIKEGEMWVIKVYGKGGKYQDAFLMDNLINEEFDILLENTDCKDDGWLFKTSYNNQLDRHNAFRIVSNIYKQAGISKKGLHALRHTLGMRLTKRDVNPLVIQRVLRHSSLATTTVYAKAEKEDVQKGLGKI